jgi:hypothetical protein
MSYVTLFQCSLEDHVKHIFLVQFQRQLLFAYGLVNRWLVYQILCMPTKHMDRAYQLY